MLRESSPNVCDGLARALRTYGVPGRFSPTTARSSPVGYNRPPVEVLFDRICRENGIEHLHTQPRSPTTTGKIERFHRALRTEFRTDRVFPDLPTAQAELDAWVHDYNHDRPHQALDMAVPADRFLTGHDAAITPLRPPADTSAAHRPDAGRSDGTWVTRRASAVGVVCVSWQQVCLGVAAAGRPIDVWVTESVLQFYDGDQLLRTQKREQHRGGESQTIHRATTAPYSDNECHRSTELDLSPITRRSSGLLIRIFSGPRSHRCCGSAI